ncbi:MAG: ABC transporter ATP-binding protein [Tenuifilaceae bacterium]|jgi:peptide/nickel transport system ATP-binding protein|nr:ABC transporter ATP-binding protein [Tenuifilaceae bacterium]
MQKAGPIDTILDVTHLSVAFGSSIVLNDLSFSLGRGESLGIVGESGSGKSITALSLMGLLPLGAKILSGNANFHPSNSDPQNLVNLNPDSHRALRGKHLAMIFQEPMTSLNPSMRCGRQVEEAITLHQQLQGKDVKRRCISLFGEMQIPDPVKAYRSYPHELSGGQKQRVMIAMALAGNPSLLIADEPTTALDVTVQKEIINLLNHIVSERGMSLIFISHDLGVIAEVTQRMLVLRGGELVESGSTSELLTAPNHPYTKGLIACKPPLNSRPVELPTVQQFLSETVNRKPDERDMGKENAKLYKQEPILSVKDVEVDYVIKRSFIGKPVKVFRAVDNLSFDLYPGETLGLVGESGCGKTTLGRAVLGLVNHQKGQITYDGKAVKVFSSQELAQFRREVQLVFQDPYSSLNPRHTIGQAILEPILFHKLAKTRQSAQERVFELLQKVSLHADSYYRYPHEFSGGQRQRIAIARALAVNPRVLVCDEMVSALDVSIQAQILNLLNGLKRDFGLTYIFISHDLSVVKYMSNRMLVMQNGKAVEFGLADHIYFSPESDYTKRLIAAIPSVHI